jgi:hypothetical protein
MLPLAYWLVRVLISTARLTGRMFTLQPVCLLALALISLA